MIDTAFLRAYTESPATKSQPKRSRPIGADKPSDYTLIFDCETTIDASQALRVGVFQVRLGRELINEGLFYDPEILTVQDIACVKIYAQMHGLNCGTIDDFRWKVLYKIGYEARAAIVGFNLPFDLSRTALNWSEARGSLRGGFTLHLSKDRRVPRIRVKHLSSTASLIDFAKPQGQDTPRGMRKRGIRVEPHRGYFIDLRTISMALLSRKHSLASLSEALDVQTQKQASDEHGGPITASYLDYARADVQATWECYEALKAKYDEHGLRQPLHRILSEASIGKAYLDAMGVRPYLACQPNTDRVKFGWLMSAYFGGRAEARIRRELVQVYCADFKSMYPTVNALMGLSRFLIADGYCETDATEETQGFLDGVTIKDMQSRTGWPELVTLVQLAPDNDLLPLRTKYTEGQDTLTIGLNHVTSDKALWYALPDVIASKLLTGKTPRIVKAIRFEPGAAQQGLQPINLFGKDRFRVDPAKDDIFTRLVDLRDEAKARKDPIEKAIKIIANATCYGIFVEVLRDDAPKPEPLMVYGPDGQGREERSKAIEEPGKFFNPLMAVMITSAARLMLALAERVASDQGLGYAFCDTDSLAMAKPDQMAQAEFISRAQNVIDWFKPLNPYAKAGSILQAEDVNFVDDVHAPLYCLAISAKRYALFNKGEDNQPIIRKASAHGLGHLMEPYDAQNPTSSMPAPREPLDAIGVKLWQHDLWYKLCAASLQGNIDQVRYNWHPNLAKPALSRYGATSPTLLRWMRHYNESKTYRSQVKPFNFLTTPLARRLDVTPAMCEVMAGRMRAGAPKKHKPPKPIAPFERDPDLAVSKAFDRETGEPSPRTSSIPMRRLYASTIAAPRTNFCAAGRVTRA